MQLDIIQVAAFVGFQLAVLGTCVGATVAAYRKSRQKPAAEWATALRESISAQLETFRAELDTLKNLPQEVSDLKDTEKRHFASLNKQIRDNLDSGDSEADTMRELMEPYLRMAAIQQQQQRPPQLQEVAPINNGPDIPASTLPRGLMESDGPDA